MGKLLTEDELRQLSSVGIIAENWYAVCYDHNSMPIAVFKSEDHAKAYRDQFTRTSVIEPWPMIKRDYRKPHTGWVI